MKSDAKDSEGDSGFGDLPPGPGAIRVCPVCDAPLTADNSGEFCPICMLRSGLVSGAQGKEEPFAESASSSLEQEFEHYELALNEEGRPVELGRGAMGVTYKAFDLELRCPVALKVIGEQYVGDEVARRRFLREARAAASLRHPNVASVFHLGRSGGNYFYAMEFVKGETLERLIKRSVRLEIRLALEITSQIAAGLVAVDKQKLVHRDIKPTNIMVSREERGAGMVKIIDLGLAKALNDSLAETAISMPGVFAGTPEFASPEQFLGIGVDIRSDLYSLGVTLWDMLTGQVPYRGPPAEVMYQHRHKPLPSEQLDGVPQPLVMLLELLLEKNPAHRFQTPTELLKALATVRGAILTGRRLLKTVRINVTSSADVQKERNLTERLIRSIAAEFDLPVSVSDLNFERLVEANLVLQNDGIESDRAEHGSVILCSYFSQYGERGEEVDQEPPLSAAELDLIVCIVWSRLVPLPGSTLKRLFSTLADPEPASAVGPPFDQAGRNRGEQRLSVYRYCCNPTPPLEPREEREEFGRQWDALQEFFATLEEESGRNRHGTVYNYRSLEEFEELFRTAFRRFLEGRFGQDVGQNVLRRKVRRWKASPFRGLNVFSFEHSPIFHGRTKAIGEVLVAMEGQVRAERPFVMVVGASGSGKSSLVQAGVLPLLTQPGTIEGIGLWRRAVTRPGAGGGGDCFDALAAALLEPAGLPALQDPESLNGTGDLARELRDHSDSVALRVRDALDHAAREWKIEHRHQLEQQEQQFRASGRLDDANLMREREGKIELPKARLALVVDQLEELFTTGFSPEVRQNYVTTIADLVRSGRVFVLATLRSDFYPWYQQFPQLIELTKPGGKVDLRAPTPYEIGEIIRLPAEAAGLHFEEERQTGQRLDEALRDAASATPESLPLLEHVLSLLYDEQASRGDNLLLWSDYRELGELKGALAKHAERVFGTLQPEEQNAFPLVMRYLVTLSQGEEEVPNRRTVPYRDFIAGEGRTNDQKIGAKGFVDLFIEKRLLVADTDPQGEVTVSVAHEALLREWQRVKEWLIENREFLRMRDRLDSSMKLWLSRGKQRDDLLGPGLPLAEGDKLIKGFGPSLSREQTDYVYASIAEQKRRQRSQERIRYAVMAGITAALIVAVIFAIVSFRQYRRAERAKISADQAAKRATLARNQAERLINFMTINLRDKLEPIGRLDISEEVAQRVLKHYDDLVEGDNSPENLRLRSIARVNLGDIQKYRGDLDGALASYKTALEAQKLLLKKGSNNVKWQRDLANSWEKIGDVLDQQGNFDGADVMLSALKCYQRSLDIRKDIAERNTKNAKLQLELSFSYADLGNMGEISKDSDVALAYYNLELPIRQKLARDDPGGDDAVDPDDVVSDDDRQRNLSNCFLQIGHVWADRGKLNDLETALDCYRRSLAIARALATKDPRNAIWKRDYAISLERLGDVLEAQGKLLLAQGRRTEALAQWTEAIETYKESLTHRLELVTLDPSNSLFQSDVSWSYREIGDCMMAQNEAGEAVKFYDQSSEILKRLSATYPTNNDWQSDLAIIRQKSGEAFASQGKSAEAMQEFSESLTICENLLRRDPKSAQDIVLNLQKCSALDALSKKRLHEIQSVLSSN